MTNASIPHLYAGLGDGRANLYGSEESFRACARRLRAVRDTGLRDEAPLSRIELPHFGLSVARLVMELEPDNSRVRITADDFCVAANSKSLGALADCLDRFAAGWHTNGHFHFSFFNDDVGWEGAIFVLEVLICGEGYLPNSMFGLPDED